MVPCTENQQEALVICLPAMEQLETLCIASIFFFPLTAKWLVTRSRDTDVIYRKKYLSKES